MHPLRVPRDERGIAIITVLLVALAIGSIAVAATLVSTNASLINRYHDQQSVLASAADAGLEQARSMVNGAPALYPDSGYATLENGAPVRDASGTVIPNLKRYLYVGPTGVTSGQYGVFGSVVSVVQDAQGNQVVRREEVVQESFAKFAYFTDVEPSSIAFGSGDAIYGPVHTNDTLKIYSSGATFYGPVTTGKVVKGAQYGTFKQGYTEKVPVVPMPLTADLTKLKALAQAGYTYFVGTINGTAGQATLRVEFVALDLNNDNDSTDADEGFIKVYKGSPNDAVWVSGDVPGNIKQSENCGHYETTGPSTGRFRDAKFGHPYQGHDWTVALTSGTKRCLLGGSDSLYGGVFTPSDPKNRGDWQLWPGPAITHPAIQARADGRYLFPMSRALNPNFKGVIYVDGKVGVSGRVRGQITLAATDNIAIVDDITYVTNPGAGTCRDMLGLFSGKDVVVAENGVNPAVQADTGAGKPYFTYDNTKDEFIHAVILALNQFTVENYTKGSTNAEPCESTARGRGCLYLTGGIIQRTRGAVGLADGHGYLKRYSYDACAFSNSPPYFPTTGHFARGRYYEVDPTGFSVDAYYGLLTP